MQRETPLISISIVVYRPNVQLLVSTLNRLRLALQRLGERNEAKPPLYLIDNGSAEQLLRVEDFEQFEAFDLTILHGHGNVGYGRGHNFAVGRVTSEFHLVLNPDVELEVDAMVRALAFMRAQPAVGLVSPRVFDDSGRQQYLCRRYPTVLDLLLRGFSPPSIRKLFTARLARYEMRDVIGDVDIVWDPPIVSGCFMLFRTDVLKKLNGFDPRYFLYFEDYDLTLRTHKIARVAYVPTVRVLHHGGDAARKGFTHIKLFITSAVRFFNRFGWKWL